MATGHVGLIFRAPESKDCRPMMNERISSLCFDKTEVPDYVVWFQRDDVKCWTVIYAGHWERPYRIMFNMKPSHWYCVAGERKRPVQRYVVECFSGHWMLWDKFGYNDSVFAYAETLTS